MAITATTKRVMEQSIGSNAAAEVVGCLDAGQVYGLPQPLSPDDSPTFVTLTLGTGGVLIAGKKIIGPRRNAIANVRVNAGAGTLPTPDSSIFFADAAAPTVLELLDAVVELNTKIDAIRATLTAHGLTG